MGFPVGAAIAGGANLLGGIFNSFGQARQNRLSREFAERMYDKQFADSTAFWHMQNQYNTPEAQMKRFEQAGLNPNLMYTKGNAGNASLPSVPSHQPGQFVNPRFGDLLTKVIPTISALYDLETKKATVSNLEAQNDVLIQEAFLKDAQTQSTITGRDRAIFDLDFAKDLRHIDADARRQSLRKMIVDTDFQLSENERRNLMTKASFSQAVESIFNSRIGRAKTSQEIKNLKALHSNLIRTGKIQELDIALKDLGVSPNSPAGVQFLARMFSNMPGSVEMRNQGIKDLDSVLSGVTKGIRSTFQSAMGRIFKRK